MGIERGCGFGCFPGVGGFGLGEGGCDTRGCGDGWEGDISTGDGWVGWV